MKQNLEEVVNSYIDKHFEIENRIYQKTIKDHLKEGINFEVFFNRIDQNIDKKLENKQFDSDYKDLKYSLEKIEEDYAFDKFNKAIESEAFKKELKIKNKTLNDFINIHKEYLAEFEVQKFHHQNREVFKWYFMIKYNNKLKYKIEYYDLNLYRGGRENNSLVIKETERLYLILNPPSKNKNYKLEKYGINLTTRDIAVFMILFKSFYKMKVDSYVEFVNISKLFFDDLHFNIKDNEVKLGTSIERYLNGKELFSSKFNFETSKIKILDTLSEINLKEFKKYVEKVKIKKFKKLIS